MVTGYGIAKSRWNLSEIAESWESHWNENLNTNPNGAILNRFFDSNFRSPGPTSQS